MTRDRDSMTIAWPLALAASATLGTMATACMMPFVAVAVLAAATMNRGSALVTVIGVWATNQLLGFALLGYPWTGYAAMWGAALGGASIAAMLVAHAVIGDRPALTLRLPAAFAAAFAAFELLLLGFAAIAGGTATFAPAIVLQLLANDAMWFAGLVALYAVLIRTAPRLFAPYAHAA